MIRHTILVTGGAGFIGANFARHAVASERRVVVLDALTYAGNRANLADLASHPNHVFVEGSIADRALVGRLLAEYRPGAIVNFAAETHVDRSIDGPGAFVRTNVDGVFELLEAVRAHLSGPAGAIGGFRFVQVSTDEVYGSAADGAFAEDSRCAPSSPYAASKAAADHLVQAWHRTYGVPAIVTRCSNNYGPYQFPEKLIPLTIANALDEKAIPVYGDGMQVRDWLHVDDHCRALELVLDRGAPGESYNIGGGATCSNIETVTRLCRILDGLRPRARGRRHAALIAHVADRPGHDRRYALDCRKISKDLGWRPTVDFGRGLERTVQWYLANPEWWRDIRCSRYGGERLGLASAVM